MAENKWIPWEPISPSFLGGYFTHILGLPKPSFFMVFGVERYLGDMTPILIGVMFKYIIIYHLGDYIIGKW